MIQPEHVRVGPSPIHGQGLFAEQAIALGQEIEYTGPLISPARINGNRYLFNVNKRHVIDGQVPANLAGYINHSCAPNCMPNGRGKKVFIVTARDILPGEELTYHYGPGYFDTFIRPHGCRCNACRDLPNTEVSIGDGGLFVTMPSGLCIGVRWTHDQRQQLAAWFQQAPAPEM